MSLSQKQDTSYLLNLPRELRDRIFDEVVFPTGELGGLPYQNTKLRLPPAQSKQATCSWAPPPLARVCRQIRGESLAIFYKKARFTFEISQLETSLPVLRKALSYLHQTQPERVLEDFWINWMWLNVSRIEHFITIVQIFGTYSMHFTDRINFGMGHTIMNLRNMEPRTCELLQDLANLGRTMNKDCVDDEAYVREAIVKLLSDESAEPETRSFRMRIKNDSDSRAMPRFAMQ